MFQSWRICTNQVSCIMHSVSHSNGMQWESRYQQWLLLLCTLRLSLIQKVCRHSECSHEMRSDSRRMPHSDALESTRPHASHVNIRAFSSNSHLAKCYGVATISRLLQITGLFWKRALQKRRYSAKETYDFKAPTHRSHPVHPSWFTPIRLVSQEWKL